MSLLCPHSKQKKNLTLCFHGLPRGSKQCDNSNLETIAEEGDELSAALKNLEDGRAESLRSQDFGRQNRTVTCLVRT
jgi:hypothetical protein